jgi:hypothetical protein
MNQKDATGLGAGVIRLKAWPTLSSQKETAGMPPHVSLSPGPGKCAGAEN